MILYALSISYNCAQDYHVSVEHDNYGNIQSNLPMLFFFFLENESDNALKFKYMPIISVLVVLRY